VDAAPVLLRREGAVAVLSLNRAGKRNALDAATVLDLRARLVELESDDALRVVLLRGEGPAFCAGADLAQLERIAGGAGPMENLADAAGLGELFVRMRRYPRPIVAAVHGQALAGGAGLALACDLVVAADDARIGFPEVHLGFVPAMVMAILRRACGEKVAFELVARGDSIDAAEAHRLGLVNRVFPAAGFDDAALDYARQLAERPAAAVTLTKRLFHGLDGLGFEDGIGRGAEVNVLARATPECQAGVRAFLERRSP
jgi:methylglutaconyl-CoA hydratase